MSTCRKWGISHPIPQDWHHCVPPSTWLTCFLTNFLTNIKFLWCLHSSWSDLVTQGENAQSNILIATEYRQNYAFTEYGQLLYLLIKLRSLIARIIMHLAFLWLTKVWNLKLFSEPHWDTRIQTSDISHLTIQYPSSGSSGYWLTQFL